MKRVIVLFIILFAVLGGKAQQEVKDGYKELNLELLKTENFWKSAKSGNFPVEMTSIVIGQNTLTKVITIFQRIQNTLQWDGTYGILPTKDLRVTLMENTGNVADVNLALCALFSECGFDASPVILNVKGDGVLPRQNPRPDDFNYVVCMLKVDSSFLLCDATAKTPVGLLPFRCLNRLGWVVNETGGNRIDLGSVGKDNISVSTLFKVNEKKIRVKIGAIEREYAAVNTLEKVAKMGELGLKEYVKAAYPGWNFTKYKQDASLNIATKEFSMHRDVDGKTEIEVHPLMFGCTLDSIYQPDFTRERVVFPVRIVRSNYVEMQVPAGYQVELPDVVEMVTGNKGALLRFQAMENEGKVVVSLTFTLNKLEYVPAEYDELKHLLEQLEKVNKAVIVFRKKV